MALRIVRIIALYEMRTLLRSWFFRIFAAGAIFGLSMFNLVINIESSGVPWIYKALAASIPYANLIVLNLGQAVVAVFLASEFLKQDRKNDTVEVIYARSMSNGQYILGKTLGILAVFLVLNIIVLMIGIGFSFINNAQSQNVSAYFAYLLLISLPTLVFILGLSFFIMVVVKNQAVTFILLTGYISLTVFYLNKKAYHLFDYIAYQVPMMYSSISGFGSLLEILMHRSIYLLLGIAFILFTVYKMQRLPQTPRYYRLPLYMGLCVLFMSMVLIFGYVNDKRKQHDFRQQAITLNNRYVQYPKPLVDSCRLELEHRDDQIAVIAALCMHNDTDRPVDTLVFSLNPGLRMEHLLVMNRESEFKRDLHLILVPLQETMKPGDSLFVTMRYAGRIIESIAFLDQTDEKFEANPYYEVFRLRKRFGFLQKNYVCLTSDLLWYPVTGTTYPTDVPMYYSPDFTRYSVRVKTRPGLTAISQGKVSRAEEGVFEFQPEYPLPRISLLIGDYVKYEVHVDSVEYGIYAIRGHEYFKPYFDQITDTLPVLIRELKKEYESGLGFKYPFKRLNLAEVPVHFSLDQHIYAYASDAIQPELILSPEKGALFSESDFRSRKYRLERNLKNNNEEVLPEVIQADMFAQFIRNNFMAKRGQHFNYDNLINWQTYSIFPEYLTFFTRLKSEQWPVLGIAVETYTSERNNKAGSTLQWYEDLSESEKINLELGNASLGQILKMEEISDDNSRYPITIRDLVQVKGIYLFNLLGAKYGDEALDRLFTGLILEHPHRPILLEELIDRFEKQFHADLKEEVRKWFDQKNLPGFIIRDISSYKVKDGEISKFQVSFQISNPENTDGIVTLNVELNDPNRRNDEFNWDNFNVDFSRKIFLPARSSFEVGYAFNTEPARMSVVTHISRNLPNNLIYSFSGFHETRTTRLRDRVIPVPFFENITGRNEIVADNEDKSFGYWQTANQAYLKALVNRNKEDRYKYSAIWAWNPPREWRAALRSEFYGNYVHSAHYTRGGTGERTAYWKAALPHKGSYDIYYYINKVNLGWRRTNKSADYNISIYHDNGVDKINQVTENVDHGWNYLGTWYISSDTGKIELSNKSIGDLVFADAVKWVWNE
jgi:ABC-type transport system involved in multi-copper enzyme maturation permease subunit